jgi:hypothetical protein
MDLIRGSFSKARIRVRLDGGFANPELLAFLDGEPGVERARPILPVNHPQLPHAVCVKA